MARLVLRPPRRGSGAEDPGVPGVVHGARVLVVAGHGPLRAEPLLAAVLAPELDAVVLGVYVGLEAGVAP